MCVWTSEMYAWTYAYIVYVYCCRWLLAWMCLCVMHTGVRCGQGNIASQLPRELKRWRKDRILNQQGGFTTRTHGCQPYGYKTHHHQTRILYLIMVREQSFTIFKCRWMFWLQGIDLFYCYCLGFLFVTAGNYTVQHKFFIQPYNATSEFCFNLRKVQLIQE